MSLLPPESVLCDAEIGIGDVRIFAPSRLKENEAGIKEAVRSLGREIVFLDDETIDTHEPSVAGFASPHIEPRLHHAGLVGETPERVVHEELQSRGIGQNSSRYSKMRRKSRAAIPVR